MRGRKAAQGEHTAVKKEHTLTDLFHELSQPVTTLCCSLEISLKHARGTRLRHDLGIALEQAQAVMQLTRAIRERVAEQYRDSAESKVRPITAAHHRRGVSLRQNFPISEVLPKTGNNLPL